MKMYVSSSRRLKLLAAVVVATLSLSIGSEAALTNQPTEEEALVVAEELKVMVSVGTQIISGLQHMINSGYPDKTRVDSDHLLQEFMHSYEQTTGSALNTDAAGLLGRSRRAFVESYAKVLEDHRDILVVGGEDAFVPAYFRSEVLAEFNERLEGQVKGYATNRESELLNPDWSIDALMDYSLFAYYIQDLLEQQNKEPVLRVVAGRVVGYYPMTLKQSCVACHTRQGLVQEVGGFGGAFITEVLLEN